jgi:hypothetical protein
VTELGGNPNWRSAIVIALGHVALAGNKLLDDGGVTVGGGNANWRSAIVIALGHVALAGNKLLDDGGVTVLGGNVNWRSAIVIALGHVALAGNKLLDAGGMTALPPPSYFKLALSFEAGRPFSACPKSERNGVHVERVTQGGTCKPRRARA